MDPKTARLTPATQKPTNGASANTKRTIDMAWWQIVLLIFAGYCFAHAGLLWFYVRDAYGKVTWHKTINSERDGLPMLRIKHLVKLFGCRIDMHRIDYPDPWGCFHSHPANAIRVILRGGYSEEYFDGTMKERKPWYIGLVKHSDVHRINRLRGPTVSYSLWFRGRVRHETLLAGEGWPIEFRNTWHRSSENET